MSRPKLQPGPVTEHHNPSDSWTIATTITHNGRHIEQGTELKIRGESGRFLFAKHVTTAAGVVWIDTVHVDSKGLSTGFRSFRPDQIQTVHRLSKTRGNAEAA